MRYTAKEIKQWDTDTSHSTMGWVPARPITFWGLYRIKLAWDVLTCKYDVLDWQNEN